MLALVVAFAWFSFDAETRAAFTFFQIATLIALGVLAGSAWVSPWPGRAWSPSPTGWSW